jgi:hypothetical protein
MMFQRRFRRHFVWVAVLMLASMMLNRRAEQAVAVAPQTAPPQPPTLLAAK